MSSSPREIGTLIVVVLRAKNLPNKRHIGKQDPYCSMRFNMETRRTKAVKRGGQHPEWDEEVRFSIYEDAEDELARTAGDKTPPPKDRFRNIKGGKSMRVCCYADDPREPELIGEAQVDLTEALTKGEVDEWFTLQNKDKYAGEVYLEMTFWSKAKPPAKKKAARPSVANPHYGGPGSFTPSSSSSEIPAALRPNRESSPPQAQPNDQRASVPDSLRPSTSAVGAPDLYIPPYNSQHSLNSHSLGSAIEASRPVYDELGMLGTNYDQRRRDSFPPASIYGYPSNGSISSQQPYQQPQYDSYSAASLAQSMSNMQLSQTPAPSLYGPATPAPGFNPPPSLFGAGVPQDNVPPHFPQGPGYPSLGYGAPSAPPLPPNGAFQQGYPPPQNGNQGGVRLVSSGFGGPPPIPTPMPFNVPPPAAVQFQHAPNPSQTPFPQQPPNPSHTPFPQQHTYASQQYPPPIQTPAPPIQNGPPPPGQYAPQMAPFSPQTSSPGQGMFPPQLQQQGPPPPQSYPQSTSPPGGGLPTVPHPHHRLSLPPQPQQPYYQQPPQQSYAPPQNLPSAPPPLQQHNSAPPPLQQHNSAGNSRPLPNPQQAQGPASSSGSMGLQLPGAYPQPNANGQQWQEPPRANAYQQPTLPGPPPPLPSQHQMPPPPQVNSPVRQPQSPPRTQFQAPPPPPNSNFQTYQNNAENELPPPPSAYQQPPSHPQQQGQSVPIGGIFPGPSTTTIYPGPPPKPPQMVAQHHGWQ